MVRFVLPLLFAGCIFAQDDVVPTEFDTYWMVFLNAGEARSQTPEEAQKLQMAHLGHLTKLKNDGTIIVAGPFEVDKDHPMRGIVLFPGDTPKEEVERLTKMDPAVKAGRLKVEILKWWTPKGAIKRGDK